MNFLAHLYLSGPSEEIMLGNFIADSVTSRTQPLFSAGIQQGIKLHRLIDSFTDSHPIVHQSKDRLRTRYHKYASVIVDVFYDHYLAVNWDKYASISLKNFADRAYKVLEQHQGQFPARTRLFYGYMRSRDMLVGYAQVSTVKMVMEGMSRRAKFVSGMETCTEELQLYYTEFGAEFATFFPELQLKVSSFLNSFQDCG